MGNKTNSRIELSPDKLLKQFLKLKSNEDKADWLKEKNLRSETINYLFIKAATEGHFGVVKYLIKKTNVYPAVGNNWSICYASPNGHFKMVNYLLENTKVDPTASYNWAIRSALANGHINISLFLASLPAVKNTMDEKLRQLVKDISNTSKENYQYALANNFVFFQMPMDEHNSSYELTKGLKERITVMGIKLAQQDMNLTDESVKTIFSVKDEQEAKSDEDKRCCIL